MIRPAEFTAALDLVTDTAVQVSAILGDPDTSLDDLANLLGAVTDAQAILGDVFAVVAAEVYPALPDAYAGYPIPTGGTIKASLGTVRKGYDQAAVVSALSAGIAQAIDAEAEFVVVGTSGERRDVRTIVERTAEALAEAAGATAPSFNSWRVNAAKRFGVDVNRYCTREAGSPRVWIEDRPHHG